MEILYFWAAAVFLSRPDVTREYAALACLAIENVVIRSLFPMSVLTKMISASKILSALTKRLAKLRLWRCLKLSDALLPQIISGLISGFPSSAQSLQTEFELKTATKSECAKALALSSLPSPAFIILAASEGIAEGIFRYAALVVTAYITALFFKSSRSKGESVCKKIPLTHAIAASAQSMLGVAGSIAFFSAMTCISSTIFPKFKPVFAVLFEMGSGIIFAKGTILMPVALGWCGLSAMMQIKALAPDISIKPYIVTRCMSIATMVGLEFLKIL